MPVNKQDIIDEEKYRIQGAKAARADVLNQPAATLPNQDAWTKVVQPGTLRTVENHGVPRHWGRGKQLPDFIVQVSDRNGDPISGVRVEIQSTTSHWALDQDQKTLANGQATFRNVLTLGDELRDYEFMISTPVLRRAEPHTVKAVNWKLLSPPAIAGPRNTDVPDDQLPLVYVFEAGDIGVSGIEVTFSGHPAGDQRVKTDANGRALCPHFQFPAGAAYDINIGACGLATPVHVSHT